jgi:hypothetical protein
MGMRTVVAHLAVTFVLAVLAAGLTTGLWNLASRGVLLPDWPVAFTVAAVLGGIAVARDVAGTRDGCAPKR